MIKRTLVFLVGLLLLASAFASPLTAAAADGSPDTGVFPAAGAPGERFGFVAGGFKSRERVAVWINAPDGRILTEKIENLTPATRQGRVSWNWTTPKDAPLGVWQMVAQGTSSGVQQLISFQLQSNTPPPAPPAHNVQPSIGAPGQLFVFYATGYLLNENVTFWVNTPDGRAVPVEPEVKRLNNGRVDWSWVAPNDAPRGTWQIVAAGLDSKFQQVITFEIR